MDRIEALKHVLQDGGFFSEEEKRSARGIAGHSSERANGF